MKNLGVSYGRRRYSRRADWPSIHERPPRPNIAASRYTITSLKYTHIPHLLYAARHPPTRPLPQSLRPHGELHATTVLIFLHSRRVQRNILSRPLKRL